MNKQLVAVSDIAAALRQKYDRGRLYVVPMHLFFALGFTFCVVLVAWPGFMGWDSLFALKQLRTGITWSGYPPVVSYVWFLPDQIIPGPGGMFLLQNALLFFGLGLLLFALRLGVIGTFALFALFVSSASIVGPMLVVWKDIGMSGFLMLATALTLLAVVRRSRALLVVAFGCIVIGGAYRLNAFPALLPLIFAVACAFKLLAQETSSTSWLRSRRNTIVLFLGLTTATLVVIAASVSFRLPDFKALPRDFSAAWTQTHDLLGISVCEGRNRLPESLFLRSFNIEELKRIYKPQHVQLSIDTAQVRNPDLLQMSGLGDVPPIWLNIVLEDPRCYFWHRFQVVKYMLGANSGDVFYPTHWGIDPNDLGIKMEPTPLTTSVVQYILRAASPGLGLIHLLARVWFYWLLASVSLVILFFLNRHLFSISALIYLSGMLYFMGSVLIVPAADLRYQHWFVVACFLSFAILCVELDGRIGTDPRVPGDASRLG